MNQNEIIALTMHMMSKNRYPSDEDIRRERSRFTLLKRRIEQIDSSIVAEASKVDMMGNTVSITEIMDEQIRSEEKPKSIIEQLNEVFDHDDFISVENKK